MTVSREGVRQVATRGEVFEAQLLVGAQLVQTQGACRTGACVNPTRRDRDRGCTQRSDKAAAGQVIQAQEACDCESDGGNRSRLLGVAAAFGAEKSEVSV